MSNDLNQRLAKLARDARDRFAEIVERDPWEDFSPAQALLAKVALELSGCLPDATSPLVERLEEALEDAEALAEWEAAPPEDEEAEGFDLQEHVAAFWNEVDGFIESLSELSGVQTL